MRVPILCLSFLIPLAATAEPLTTLDMDEAVRLALENNLDVRIAAEAENSAEAADWSAMSNFFPHVAAGVTYLKYSGAYPTTGMSGSSGYSTAGPGDPWWGIDESVDGQGGLPGDVDYENFSTSITLTQPIFNGGAVYWGKVMAAAGEEMAELQLVAARQAAILAVKQAYLDSLRADELLAVQRKNQENLTHHVQITQVNLDVGLASRVDLLRAESELAAAEGEVITAQNIVRLSRVNLADVIGVELDREVRLTPVDVGEPTGPAISLDEALDYAGENNPGLKAVRKSERLAEGQFGLASSAFWPKINLQAAYGWVQGDDFAFYEDDDYWRIGVSASLDLFASTRRLADVAQARAEERKTRLEIQLTEQAIMTGVEAAYLGLTEKVALIGVSAKQLEAAGGALDIMEQMAAQGLVSDVEADYLDINLAYLMARLGEVSARYDYLVARENLASLMGAIEP
ncbi:MAG TPA: TolC family protein [bacterium]|nr:TolC family protein [bacterium]